MYSITEAAQMLNKQYYHIVYALKTRRLPEVKRFHGQRVFSPTDILRLAHVFGLPADQVEEVKRRLAIEQVEESALN